ncbi:hypothetical protein GYMLUDRAFT_60624 [Collybiopsis luxurians FD-317 M1]|uniref:Unplaced genomic scaffold GYMLUscaffold_36, whole genome shotgun sequence n=1 Tax=Collybiopsis luxurians FD-317 M1 TaxID=944289 RepID=A0A0D0CSF5_9AGAR|nr:hypothetical protein GYMLUDRAFT_60624 [Collybiopsis luxurians FD-317 M1]
MPNSPSPRSTNNSPPPSGDPHNTSPLRPSTHEATTSAVEHNSPSTSTFVPPSTPEPIAGPSRIRPRETSNPSNQPMAKRLRAEPAGSRQSDRSSPSSDSQGGMADTEDTEQRHGSERSPPPSDPPKKKRTRTLTTPHQSAVLHALLAKSRFPTTAMREEVGRAIGLSARKVQNQRQKARRPRTTNEMPMTRPPQYGPFPSGGDTDILNLYPRSQPGGAFAPEFYDPRAHPSQSPTYPHPATFATSSNLPSGLLGPGVPGVPGLGGSMRPQESQSPTSPTTDIVTGPHLTTREFLRRSLSPPRRFEHEQLRPASPRTSSSNIPYRDASRTLPPLVFPQQSHEGIATLPTVRSAPANVPPPSPFQRTRSPPFAFTALPVPPEPVGTVPSGLPPPFTLEPQPQWNDPIFTSVPLTGSSTWSVHSSERGGSLSPTTSRGARGLSGQDHLTREGRYDPVRSMFVPYRSPNSPPPPSRPGDHENE